MTGKTFSLDTVDPRTLATDAAAILATNERQYSRLSFVNPEDPALESLKESIERQQKEYAALLKKVPAEDRDSITQGAVAGSEAYVSGPVVGQIINPATPVA